MKRKSVILSTIFSNENALITACLFSIVIFASSALTFTSSGGTPFRSFLVGLAFAFSWPVVCLIEFIIRNILGGISDMVKRITRPASERALERSLEQAKSNLIAAKIQLELEQTLLETRRVHSRRQKMVETSLHEQMATANKVLEFREHATNV